MKTPLVGSRCISSRALLVTFIIIYITIHIYDLYFIANAIQIEVLQYTHSIRSRFTYYAEPMSMSACRLITSVLFFSTLPDLAGWSSGNTVDMCSSLSRVDCCSYWRFLLSCDSKNNTSVCSFFTFSYFVMIFKLLCSLDLRRLK
jgi:hypothetical protein